MDPSHPIPERGRARRRSQSFRKPFHQIKSIWKRKSKLNRSMSRDRSPLPQFTSGTIIHAHSIVVDPNVVPLYIPIHIDLSGAIIAPDDDQKIGSVLCDCGHLHNTNSVKNILFSSKPTSQAASGSEHYVASPFIVPEVTESYRRIHSSFPILFRMDQGPFADNIRFGEPLGEQIPFVSLKTQIHSLLLEMEKQFKDEEVSHIYEQLFDVSSQVDDSSLDPSAPLYREEPESAQRVPVRDESTLPLDRFDFPPPAPTGRSFEIRPNFTPSSFPSQQPKDFLGLLFVPSASASILDIPKVKNVKILEDRLKELSQSNIKAIFIVRNLSSLQFDLFPFASAPSIPVFTLSVVSPQRMFVAVLNCSEIGVSGSPQVSLQQTPRLLKWYTRIYRGVSDQDLFSKPPPSSCPSNAPSSASGSEDEKSSTRSWKSISVRSTPRSTNNPVLKAAQPLTSSLKIDVYIPPILSQQDCPENFKIFWSQKASPRPSLFSASNKPMPEDEKHVAPRYPVKMLEVATHVNLPNLLADEFEAYAKAYQAIVIERKYSNIDASSGHIVQIAIQNDAAVLARLGKDKILETLKRNAPILREQKLENLTEAELQSFFFQARTYLLDNQAPYWSFPDYFLNAKTLGANIFNKITELLWGYPTYKTTLKQFSSFIESSIRQILPIQESFTDSEERIIANHRSILLGPVPSVDHTKISLQADAQELLIKSPYYKQNKNKITEDLKRQLIDMHKSNLIIKIISNTHFEKDLIQLLIANDKYRSLDVVPFPELITNLENLILVAQKAETIEVNTTAKGGRLSRPTSRSRPTAKKSPNAKKSPSPKSKSPRPPRPRSRNPSKGQEACDICLSYSFDPRWCRQQDHCRVPGHQPSTNRSETRERQIRSGDLSCFVMRKNCNICNHRVMNVQTWPTPPPSHPQTPNFPPNRPPSPRRPSEANSWAPWNFPPPRPSNYRPPSKSPSRFANNRR